MLFLSSKVGSAMASGSNGSTAGSGDQNWSSSSGNGRWWHHPHYGSYESQSWDSSDTWWGGKGKDQSKGKWVWQEDGVDAEPTTTTDDGPGGDGDTGGPTTSRKRPPPPSHGLSHGLCLPLSDNDLFIHHRLGNLAKAKADDADDDDEEDTWENETEEVIEKKKLFWEPEAQVRLHSGGMTPFEKHQMTESYPAMLSDMKKIMAMYGLYKGPTRAARTVLKTIAEGKSMVPSQMVEVDTPEFTICKHLLLAAWDGFPDDIRKMQVEKCNCFPRTALMPLGCRHIRTPMWKLGIYYHSLCKSCSTCMRCGGTLGSNKLLQQVKNTCGDFIHGTHH